MKLGTLGKRERTAYIIHARRIRDDLRRVARKGSPGRPPVVARRRVSREEVQDKTDGNCHMCGDSLEASWQIGHVKPYRRGGACDVRNCLPICAKCNRLRWSYRPDVLRFMLLFGRYAKQAIRGKGGKPTALGEELIKLHVRSTWGNKKRATRADY
jgi:5-methylcytosine-specific restriction endonuclease McrA